MNRTERHDTGRARARLGVAALGIGLVMMVAACIPEPAADKFVRLRQCESSGNYNAVSANGLYHGAYQFNLNTWRSVMGTDYYNDRPETRGKHPSPGRQDIAAFSLSKQGTDFSPWPACAKKLGLPR